MTLPRFEPEDDPGPSFAALLRRVSHDAGFHGSDTFAIPASADLASPVGVGAVPRGERSSTPDGLAAEVRHGTTCVAVRWSGGVVLAGDRRATSGNFISHHSIEKVFPADSHSGIAISGAAGPAAEMVRLFQLQLEHYEKVEGTPISLDGKANQLSQMVRANLPAAMSGLGVLPIFAGFDPSDVTSRIFEYDLTGGRYEERDHASAGSGAIHAETVLKLGFRPSQGRRDAVDLALEALLVAADSDAATGGPDVHRGVFPVVAVIDADGYRRVDDSYLSDRTDRLIRRSRDRRREGDRDQPPTSQRRSEAAINRGDRSGGDRP